MRVGVLLHRPNRCTGFSGHHVAMLARARLARPMVGSMRAAHGLFVKSLVSTLSGGSLLGAQVLRLRWFFIAVIFVAELRRPVCGTDWQIHALAAPVSICKRAFEILGIVWIRVTEPIPAFPEAVDVRVMEIE